MDYSLSDELLAISSIYGDDVLTPEPSSEPPSCILHVPHSSGVELRLVFRASYPAGSPPAVAAVVHSGDESVPQGHGKRVMRIVADKIAETFSPDQPVLFELIEALMDMQDDLGTGRDAARPDANPHDAGDGLRGDNDAVLENGGVPAESGDRTTAAAMRGADDAVQWVASDVVVEKKSAFVAHACAVANAAEAKRNVGLLIAGDRKFAKATHNISAYKGRYKADGGAGGVERELVFQDCDDDGEDAAGGRLLHLIELTGAENVLVVVSRWYGGVKLGPDRFRIINQVAREALVRGGWVREASNVQRPTRRNK